ncbi:hypothetical protein NFI96_010222 [Prochilodus magdalenae]|nr:hypothetical protein NFI96_010222 [Prochilodus magdalenae]
MKMSNRGMLEIKTMLRMLKIKTMLRMLEIKTMLRMLKIKTMLRMLKIKTMLRMLEIKTMLRMLEIKTMLRMLEIKTMLRMLEIPCWDVCIKIYTMSCFAPVLEVGGNGGTPFNFRGTDGGASLEKIAVWAGGLQIKAIKIWLTNGKHEKFGKAEGEYSEYLFKPGELITSLSLWDNADGKKPGTRLGAIKFTTNLDGSFFSKMTDLDLQKEHPADVGSGVCMGVVGRAGEDIDKLGFLFINPIKSTVLTNIDYPTLYDVIPEVDIEELKSMTYRNDTSVTQEYTLETSERVTRTSSWSVTNKIELTFSMKVKTGIPLVIEVENGFSFTVGRENTYALEYSEEKEEKVSVPVRVIPGKSVYAKVSIGRAVVDLPYNGTVRITCYNDSVLEFKISGIYRGLTYTTADVHVMEKNPPLLSSQVIKNLA